MVSEVQAPSAQEQARTHSVDSFAAALRALRRQAGEPTLVALSAQTGVSKSVISEALSGRALPSERTVFHLVRVLGGDPDSWLAQRGALDPAALDAGQRSCVARGHVRRVWRRSPPSHWSKGFASRVWRLHPRVILATTAAFSAIMTSMIWLLVETR